MHLKEYRVPFKITTCLQATLQVSYYFLVVPNYTIVTNSVVKVKRCLPHTITCGILTIISFLHIFYEFYTVLGTSKFSSVQSYFEIILQTVFTLARLVTIKILWIDCSNLSAVFNGLVCLPEELNMSRNKISYPPVAYILCFLFLFSSAYFRFEIEGELFKNATNLFVCGLPAITFDSIFKLVLFIGAIHSQLLASFGNMFVFNVILTFNMVSYSFSMCLNRSLSIAKLMHLIRVIRILSDNINKCICHIVTCLIIQFVVYYALTIDGMQSTNKPKKLNPSHLLRCSQELPSLLFYFTLFASIFLLAAQIPQNCGKVKTWVLEMSDDGSINKETATFVLFQAENNLIGCIKASNVYPVTYGVVSSVISNLQN